MEKFFYTFGIILLIYTIISVLLYYLQESFIFKPEKLSTDFQFSYENQEFEEYNFDLPDGAIINGLRFKAKNPKGVVMYLKGNSKSIKGWGKFAVDFTAHGYDVAMIDYRGFGKSTGKRSQEAIKRDMQFIYDKIKEKIDEKYIIIYGRSLGSGFATKLASINNPKMLILDAPYYSMKNITARYLPFMPLSIILRYPIPTYKWIKHVKCPIHIIHGTNDKLIPFSAAIKLSKKNPEMARLYPIIDGGHKNLNNFEAYHKVLAEILLNHKNEIDLSKTSIHVQHNKKKNT
ncbi:alpha/beta fold hydrolase [Flavobacterium sp.]|uniref:alpha/beta hydrolase n=1 Tax=Flavobacterium sp. TaxID=239 RepID=UPI00286C3ACE|nr:alpha/beta fold hydrolase [Flavobacterium sp.]